MLALCGKHYSVQGRTLRHYAEIEAQILALRGNPRGPVWKAAIALAIPVVLFMGLLSVRAAGEAAPPIHDVATDLRNPPAFSAQTMQMREEWGANPVVDYGTPLGQLDLWKDRVDGDLKEVKPE